MRFLSRPCASTDVLEFQHLLLQDEDLWIDHVSVIYHRSISIASFVDNIKLMKINWKTIETQSKINSTSCENQLKIIWKSKHRAQLSASRSIHESIGHEGQYILYRSALLKFWHYSTPFILHIKATDRVYSVPLEAYTVHRCTLHKSKRQCCKYDFHMIFVDFRRFS